MNCVGQTSKNIFNLYKIQLDNVLYIEFNIFLLRINVNMIVFFIGLGTLVHVVTDIQEPGNS